jgi:hypothetical protein
LFRNYDAFATSVQESRHLPIWKPLVVDEIKGPRTKVGCTKCDFIAKIYFFVQGATAFDLGLSSRISEMTFCETIGEV